MALLPIPRNGIYLIALNRGMKETMKNAETFETPPPPPGKKGSQGEDAGRRSDAGVDGQRSQGLVQESEEVALFQIRGSDCLGIDFPRNSEGGTGRQAAGDGNFAYAYGKYAKRGRTTSEEIGLPVRRVGKAERMRFAVNGSISGRILVREVHEAGAYTEAEFKIVEDNMVNEVPEALQPPEDSEDNPKDLLARKFAQVLGEVASSALGLESPDSDIEMGLFG